MKIKYHFFVFLLYMLTLMGLLVFPASAQAQKAIIAISPVEVFMQGAPGSTVNKEVLVYNRGDGAFLFECEFEDYWFEGSKRKTAPLGTFKQKQIGALSQCSPNRVLIPAQRVQKVQVLTAIPKDAVGDQFAVFYAKMMPPQSMKDPNKANVGMMGRIGGRVVVTPSGTQQIAVAIKDAVIKRQKNYQVFSAQLENLGNVHLMGEGSLVLEGAGNTFASKAKIVLEFTFPGMTQEIKSTILENVPPGQYKGILSVSPSHTTGSSFVKEFDVKVE